MPKSPLQSTVEKWNQRAASFAASGVPAPVIKVIGDQDIEKVKRGGGGLTDIEARLSIAAAMGQGQIIPQKERGTKPTDIPGNVVRDIGDMARGILKLPQAIAHIPTDISDSVRAFTDPKFAQEKGLDPAEGFSPSELAKGLRNVASLPIMKWVPGVQTAAGVTTSEGRKELERHPAGTALDVGAAFFPAAKAVGQLNLAKKGLLTETVNRKGFTIAPEAKGTLAADAARGHIIGHGIKKSPILGDYVQKLTDKIELSRGHSIAGEKVKRDFEPIVAKLNEITKELTPEQQVKFYDDVTNGRIPDNPDLQVAYDTARELDSWLEREYIEGRDLAYVTIGDREFVYSTKGRGGALIRAKHKLDYHQDKLGANLTRAANVTANLEKQIDNWQRSIDKLQTKLDHIRSLNPTPKRRRTAMKVGLNIQKIQKKIEDAPKRPGYANAMKALENRQKLVARYQDEFDTRSLNTAPANFHPMLQSEMKARAAARIAEMRELGLAPEIIQRAMNSLELGKYSTLFTKQEWQGLTKEIEQGWQALAAEGLDPMFVHVVPESQIGKGGYHPLDYDFTPGQVRERIWSNMTPTRQNIGIALSHAAQEFLRERGSEQAFMDYIVPRGLTEDMVDKELAPQILKESKSQGITPAAAREKLFHKNYVKVSDIEHFAFRSPRMRAMMNGKELYIPKHLAKTWSDLSTPKKLSTIGKISTKATAAFKISLFSLSLRHAADEILGGMVMLMGRGDWRDITSVKQAVNMVRQHETPVEIPQTIDIDTPDKLLQLAAGAKGARILSKIYGKVGALQRFTIFMTNIEKAMGYLGETKRATAKGYSKEIAHDLGLKHVEKTFVDWHSMLPIERTIIRQWFPFYAFTRYALRYALTYPIDHPYRASILYHLAAAEREDWDSGLPQLWQQLFFIGDPDREGNVKASDIKVLNPFRDIDSMMSLQGFYSQLGPLPKIALLPLGANTILGTPDMYPDLVYDEETGRLVTKREGVTQMAVGALGALLPPAQAIEHFLQTTESMRNLKATNPQAYERQLYSALGLPAIPTEYSVPKARAKGEIDRYRSAAGKVSTALRSGNAEALEGMDIVPFQGQFVSADLIKQILEKLNTPEGISPKAVIPSYNRPKNPPPLPKPTNQGEK